MHRGGGPGHRRGRLADLLRGHFLAHAPPPAQGPHGPQAHGPRGDPADGGQRVPEAQAQHPEVQQGQRAPQVARLRAAPLPRPLHALPGVLPARLRAGVARHPRVPLLSDRRPYAQEAPRRRAREGPGGRLLSQRPRRAHLSARGRAGGQRRGDERGLGRAHRRVAVRAQRRHPRRVRAAPCAGGRVAGPGVQRGGHAAVGGGGPQSGVAATRVGAEHGQRERGGARGAAARTAGAGRRGRAGGRLRVAAGAVGVARGGEA